jgi:hypothetical protein
MPTKTRLENDMKAKIILIIIFAIILAACVDPTPTPGLPVPGDPEIITIGDISFPLPPIETPEPLVLAGGVRYEPDPWGTQEVWIELTLAELAYSGETVSLCVNGVCRDVTSNDTGYASAEFERNWPIGAVPWTACVTDEGQISTVTVCLHNSFMAEDGGQ